MQFLKTENVALFLAATRCHCWVTCQQSHMVSASSLVLYISFYIPPFSIQNLTSPTFFFLHTWTWDFDPSAIFGTLTLFKSALVVCIVTICAFPTFQSAFLVTPGTMHKVAVYEMSPEAGKSSLFKGNNSLRLCTVYAITSNSNTPRSQAKNTPCLVFILKFYSITLFSVLVVQRSQSRGTLLARRRSHTCI